MKLNFKDYCCRLDHIRIVYSDIINRNHDKSDNYCSSLLCVENNVLRASKLVRHSCDEIKNIL